jgi:threonine/homoserine/homoserine lactone efflux protein
MEFNVYIRCFLIGLLASSSLGPIFILTFNRGSLYGFSRGFATAFGACIADGIYFFLGLLGLLAVLKESAHFMFVLDILGGFLLMFLGIYSLRKAKSGKNFVSYDHKLGISVTAVKSFLLTIFNPLVILFFMVVGVQILPESAFRMSIHDTFISSLFLMSGSLTILTIVAFIASRIGGGLGDKSQRIISLFTGIIFIGISIYFLEDLYVNIMKIMGK